MTRVYIDTSGVYIPTTTRRAARVYCLGGGGGGAGGRLDGSQEQGGGGGQGGWTAFGQVPITAGTPIICTVGAGGAGGGIASNGENGGSTYIGLGYEVYASGGRHGWSNPEVGLSIGGGGQVDPRQHGLRNGRGGPGSLSIPIWTESGGGGGGSASPRYGPGDPGTSGYGATGGSGGPGWEAQGYGAGGAGATAGVGAGDGEPGHTYGGGGGGGAAHLHLNVRLFGFDVWFEQTGIEADPWGIEEVLTGDWHSQAAVDDPSDYDYLSLSFGEDGRYWSAGDAAAIPFMIGISGAAIITRCTLPFPSLFTAYGMMSSPYAPDLPPQPVMWQVTVYRTS